jgi:hypothetical protein
MQDSSGEKQLVATLLTRIADFRSLTGASCFPVAGDDWFGGLFSLDTLPLFSAVPSGPAAIGWSLLFQQET